jgi:3-oxoacyl-[acyl-carrier-protein] synthase-3
VGQTLPYQNSYLCHNNLFMKERTHIIGTGSAIPSIVKKNIDFTVHNFYDEQQERIQTDPLEVVKKFEKITGIRERRYAQEHLESSDLGFEAAQKAIEDAGIDPNMLSHIIVAHNFGNVRKHTIQTDILPSLAARISNRLGITNPQCVPYDLLFGCPGWVQGLIHADAFFKAGMGKYALVVGTETLSRVLDPYDRDSMIFSDGAGACVLEFKPSVNGSGLAGSATIAHTGEEAFYLDLGKSNFPESDPRVRYIKMKGRKVYEYALSHVPKAMKNCLERSDIQIDELHKVLIHQANEKLDEAIIKGFYKLYDCQQIPPNIMPMSIHLLGNSSVATVPTLLDLILKGQIDGHSIQAGDAILMASVGAGMNINAVGYRF